MLLQLLQLQKSNDCTHNSCFFYKLKGLILNLNETQLELKKAFATKFVFNSPYFIFFKFFLELSSEGTRGEKTSNFKNAHAY